MDKKDTGGAAFPVPDLNGTPYGGMTLRQYYVGEALKAMGPLPWLYQYTDCAGEREEVDKENKRIADQAAESANIYADAMIRVGTGHAE